MHGQVVVFAVNGALYYVHNDHLGRAERITNASKSTVWRANNYDFDRVVAYGSADWYNLGFPGQYYDSEKDSYYNYFRDYDPKIGRYIQSDPIGLAGGINTFSYVGNNPLKFTDRFGLIKCDNFVKQMLAMVDASREMSQLGGFMVDFAINLTRNGPPKGPTSGFRPELVANGQDSDVMRHIYMNAGGVLSSVGGGVTFGMMGADGVDILRGRGGESVSEQAGNVAGYNAGQAIAQRYNAIKYGSDCQKDEATDALKSDLMKILCR